MKLVPLADRVVLKQLVAEETTKSGIVLPGQNKEKPFISYNYNCYYTSYTFVTFNITFLYPQGAPDNPVPASWQAYLQTFHTVHRKTAPVPTAQCYPYRQYR